jgi:hypothetical protein
MSTRPSLRDRPSLEGQRLRNVVRSRGRSILRWSSLDYDGLRCITAEKVGFQLLSLRQPLRLQYSPVASDRAPKPNNYGLRVQTSGLRRTGRDPKFVLLGSGTTLIAAETTGRVCLALELEPRFVDVAVLRWEAFTGMAATLFADGRSFHQVAKERGAGGASGAVQSSGESHPAGDSTHE